MWSERYNYTVFKRDNTSPTGYEMVAFNATPNECAEKMHIKPETFHSYKSEMKRGMHDKWLVFRCLTPMSKEARRPKVYAKCQVLKDIDFSIISDLHNGMDKNQVAQHNWMTVQAIEYHFKKIKRLTGLDVFNADDLEELYKKYVEDKK